MPLETPPGYRALDEGSLAGFLSSIPGVAERLGGDPAGWKVAEVGDGNLNLVFLVDGPAGAVCVKQALPYLRLVGEGWPLGLQRAYFEQLAMKTHGPLVGPRIPHLIHYDPALYAIVMEKLSPHIIMRRGMVAGTVYPHFADHIADHLARSLFGTSDLALPAAEKKRLTAEFCGNSELCKLTEDVIFTDPYMVHPRNRWTSPQLDATAARVRGDTEWKLAASRLKLKFLASPEALLHGDLHTGSVMVTEEDTRVIDPEFAFFGPMGFDVGAVLGNLLLNYFAQDGHAAEPDGRAAYQDWVLETVERVWTLFEARFLALWRGGATGDAYPASLFADGDGVRALEAERRAYMARLLADSLGFAGAKMTRRILGIAHNIDLEWIADADRRALCETRCLTLARRLMVEAGSFAGIADVTAAARDVRAAVKNIGL
ncbi:MAG TPA: S-methyl-5-thioribose kinase [Azospirillaceae bacterium]|nr:S-methyl-5-thioribose kinase [Azospirillaceae bacterium]